MFKLFSRIIALVAVVVVSSGFLSGWSSKPAKVWSAWQGTNVGNAATVDHSSWSALLQKHIRTDANGLNRFAYGAVSPADQKQLKDYIQALGNVDIKNRNRDVQLAYWLNLYNAVTIDVILEHYPVKSIRDIDLSGILSNGPWDAKVVSVNGIKMTLNNIEHDILRPIWKDPRIHYGVNCASVGCPNLQTEAFTAANVNAQLEKGARDYVNSPRGLMIRNGKVTVSKIYKWFAHDFGNSQKGVLAHLAKYASPETAKKLKAIGRISNTVYDWSLNTQSPPAG